MSHLIFDGSEDSVCNLFELLRRLGYYKFVCAGVSSLERRVLSLGDHDQDGVL